MKLCKSLFVYMSMLFVLSANAADITIFYSPSCPHCHHARNFIETQLVYEYENLVVNEVDVTDQSNRDAFIKTIKNCKYETGGVPILKIGEKCFQGYADSMQGDIRNAVEIDMTDEQKMKASSNKQKIEENKDKFIAEHAERQKAILRQDIKKNDVTGAWFYLIISLIGVGLLLVLFKKNKK